MNVQNNVLLFLCLCLVEVSTFYVADSQKNKGHENIPLVSHIRGLLEAMIPGAGLRTKAWS
jgi:hypothetical protein